MRTYIIALITLQLLAACGNKTEKPAEQTATKTQHDSTAAVSFTAQQLKSVGIETGHPKIESIGATLMLQGKIDLPPQNMVTISCPLGGYLKSTGLLPGMHVRKGQVLGVLEDMQFIQLQQDYLTAKEEYILAEADSRRQAELNASKAASDKVYQQAKAQMASKKILVSALGQKLSLLGIRPESLTAENITRTVNILSPIDGYVSKVNVNIGKYTSPTDILFELININDAHLVLDVFENDLYSLSVGQEVTAWSNMDPGKKYKAKIILISKDLNQDRMAEVHCHFANHDVALAPNLFMNGQVSISKNNALTVPEDAVVRWEKKYYVFLQKGDHHFEMVEVKPGALSAGRQQIEAPGVNEDTELVVKNAYAVLMKIRNVEEEE